MSNRLRRGDILRTLREVTIFICIVIIIIAQELVYFTFVHTNERYEVMVNICPERPYS